MYQHDRLEGSINEFEVTIPGRRESFPLALAPDDLREREPSWPKQLPGFVPDPGSRHRQLADALGALAHAARVATLDGEPVAPVEVAYSGAGLVEIEGKYHYLAPGLGLLGPERTDPSWQVRWPDEETGARVGHLRLLEPAAETLATDVRHLLDFGTVCENAAPLALLYALGDSMVSLASPDAAPPTVALYAASQSGKTTLARAALSAIRDDCYGHGTTRGLYPVSDGSTSEAAMRNLAYLPGGLVSAYDDVLMADQPEPAIRAGYRFMSLLAREAEAGGGSRARRNGRLRDPQPVRTGSIALMETLHAEHRSSVSTWARWVLCEIGAIPLDRIVPFQTPESGEARSRALVAYYRWQLQHQHEWSAWRAAVDPLWESVYQGVGHRKAGQGWARAEHAISTLVRFAVSAGALNVDEATAYMERTRALFLEAGEHQAELVAVDAREDVENFRLLLAELYASGQLAMAHLHRPLIGGVRGPEQPPELPAAVGLDQAGWEYDQAAAQTEYSTEKGPRTGPTAYRRRGTEILGVVPSPGSRGASFEQEIRIGSRNGQWARIYEHVRERARRRGTSIPASPRLLRELEQRGVLKHRRVRTGSGADDRPWCVVLDLAWLWALEPPSDNDQESPPKPPELSPAPAIFPTPSTAPQSSGEAASEAKAEPGDATAPLDHCAEQADPAPAQEPPASEACPSCGRVDYEPLNDGRRRCQCRRIYGDHPAPESAPPPPPAPAGDDGALADPRPDLTEDAELWAELLGRAVGADVEVRERLLAARIQGVQLVREGETDLSMRRPHGDDAPDDAAWEEFVTYLRRRKDVLSALLKPSLHATHAPRRQPGRRRERAVTSPTRRDREPERPSVAVLSADGLLLQGGEVVSIGEGAPRFDQVAGLARQHQARHIWTSPEGRRRLPDDLAGWVSETSGEWAVDPVWLDRTGWMRALPPGATRGASALVVPRAEFANPFAALSDPAELLEALKLFAELTTVAYTTSPGVTGLRLAERQHRGDLRNVRLDQAEEPPPPVQDRTQGERDIIWSRAPTDAERRMRFLHRWDKNGCYLAAMSGLHVGFAPWCHVGAGEEIDPTRPGYYLARQAGPARPELPPVLQYGGEWHWYTAPTLELAMDLELPIEVSEAYMWEKSHTWLNPFYKQLRDARTAAMSRLGPAAAAVKDAVKLTANFAVGKLNEGWQYRERPWEDNMTFRPDWRHSVIAKGRANMWRGFAKIEAANGHAPLAVWSDAAWYASDEADPDRAAAELGIPLGPGLGQFKHEATLPMTPALKVMERGGPDGGSYALLRKANNDGE